MRYVILIMLLIYICSTTICGKAIAQENDLNRLEDFVGNFSVFHLLGYKATEVAMRELGFNFNSPDVLVLTDAGYVKIGKHTTEKALDGVIITSGLSRGKNNLLNIHKPYNSKLWFAFFNKKTKECVYLEVNERLLEEFLDGKRSISEFINLKDEEIFRISKENIDAHRLLNNPEEWQKKMDAKVFGGNEFSIITICNLWAYKGLPSDFARAAELHDHICPGLTSGYLIAKYVEKELPTKDPRRNLYVMAIPPWCKDDAIIQYFETNVGHKHMFVKWLTNEQKKKVKESLSENLKPYSPANIFVRCEGKCEGVLVGFNWEKAYAETKPENVNLTEYKKWLKDFKTWHWWWLRLKMDLWMADYMDKPEELVTILKKFELKSPNDFYKLASAGVDPLAEIGVYERQTISTKQTPKQTPGFEAMIAVVGLIVVSYVLKKIK